MESGDLKACFGAAAFCEGQGVMCMTGSGDCRRQVVQLDKDSVADGKETSLYC